MTDQLCPKCGKPVRPGAQFCGNCGANLPGNFPPKPSAGPTPGPVITPGAGLANAQQSAAPVCPHCGKPVRAEAKFCPNCGQTIARGAPQATPQPGAAQPARPQPARTPQPVTPPPAVQAKPANKVKMPKITPPAGAKGKGFFRKYWIFIVLFFVLIGMLVATFFVLKKVDPWGWFDKKGTEATHKPTETKKPAETENSEVTVTPTLLGSHTVTPAITSTPEITITPDVTSTINSVVPPPTATLTATLDSAAVFSGDDFSGNLKDKWALWGPQVPTNPNGELQLNHKYAGLTTKGSVTLVSGLKIQFKAHGNEALPASLIVFDWDAGDVLRQAVDKPGLIRVEIGNGFSKLQVNSSWSCQLVSDAKIHTYEITISATEVILSMDGIKCTVQVPLPAVVGHISFSGLGYVDDILVIRP